MRVEGYAGSLERVFLGVAGCEAMQDLGYGLPRMSEDELRRTPLWRSSQRPIAPVLWAQDAPEG